MPITALKTPWWRGYLRAGLSAGGATRTSRSRPYCVRWNVREVFERLERLGVQYYMTGSEALARYGEPRQTMDVDIVVGLAASEFDTVARAFEDDFLVNEPLDFGAFSLASLIAKSALGKADLILDRRDGWSHSAMDRRVRWEDHPLYGPLWVVSLEDLVLAKLEWSKGSSELQLRDCRNLLALNRDMIDWSYVERWAAVLEVSGTLDQVRNAD